MILMIILILTTIMILNVIASLILVQSVSPSMRLTTLFSTGNLQLSNYVKFRFVSTMDFISDRHSRSVNPSPALILLTGVMFAPQFGPAGTTQSLLMER